MSSRRVWIVIAALGVAAIVAVPVVAQDATLCTYMAGYTPEHSGVSPDEVQLPLSLNWRFSVELDEAFNAVGSAAVGPDRVYFPSEEALYAVDRATGAQVWKLNIGAKIYSAPLLRNGVLYFGAENKQFYAVDADSGNRLAALKTGGAIKCTPMYVAGILYFASDDGRVYAVDPDPNNMRLYWQYQTGDDVRATPSYYRGTVYVASTDEYLYAIRDGAQSWRVRLPSKYNFAAPVIERGKVIVASGNKLSAYDARSGGRRWTFTSGGLIAGTPAADRRRVFAASHDGVLYCIDSNNGRIRWRFPKKETRQPMSSQVSVAGDYIVGRSGDTNIFALRADDGSLVWEYKLPEPSEKAKEEDRGRRGRPGRGEDDLLLGGGTAAEMDMPEDEGRGPRGGRGEQRTEITFEQVVTPGVSLTENGGYVVSVDGALFGFDSFAADNVKPEISAALLDIPGRGDVRARFPLVVDRGDTFSGRYADLVEQPGSPPLTISVKVVDTGTGINPDAFDVTLDGETVSATYDSSNGLLWYEYNPRGAASPLPNGVRNLKVAARDWAGNTRIAQMSFTVDNSLDPPGPKQPERRGPEEGPMGPEEEMMPPEDMFVP
ncbi:MAG: PQQ-binding-like beta-propeller repeat protein [Armatimonadota bacterium]